ncbi:MAG: hypothetical protein KF833_10830 [Verrucomicrobiae bacterium]|nr:hypothetical protein [Verrucomicrobiae bacterium]
MPEHYFYHSFSISRPHECRQAWIDRCFTILRSIFTRGIVLTPELVEFKAEELQPRSGEQIPPILQVRFCLTQLDISDLKTHCDTFGPVSLEFDRSAIRDLGALPVIYIPQVVDKRKDLMASIGYAFVSKLRYVRRVLDELAALRAEAQAFDQDESMVVSTNEASEEVVIHNRSLRGFLDMVKPKQESLEELSSTIQALSCLFFPAGPSCPESSQMDYYHEREWRVISEILNSGDPVDAPLNLVEKADFAKIYPSWNLSLIPFGSETLRYLDCCRIIRDINCTPIKSRVRRVILPQEIHQRAKEELSALGYVGEVTPAPWQENFPYPPNNEDK